MSRLQNEVGHADTIGLEHLDGLYRYALFLTRSHETAEDVVQETYLRAIQAIERLQPDSNLKSWLFKILRNVCLNHLRNSQHTPQVLGIDLDNHVVEGLMDAYDIYVRKLEAEQVRAAIQKLPKDLREIILLREYEELLYQDIANVMSCPIGTVMSRLARARAKLRELLFTQVTTFSPPEMRDTK
jgi:RNA polymerase sigma-70 factor (ECF subfamily)